MESTIIKSRNFNASFGANHVVKNVNIDIPRNHIIAVMGPSGCGKTTYLRCINRMHELIPGATCSGEMDLNGEDIYKMHPIFVRLKIGMVFQRPNPFPNLSIYDNVIAGYKLNGSLLREGCVDELLVYVAPSLLGTSSLGMIDIAAPATLDARTRLTFHAVDRIGDDLRILARLVRAEESQADAP